MEDGRFLGVLEVNGHRNDELSSGGGARCRHRGSHWPVSRRPAAASDWPLEAVTAVTAVTAWGINTCNSNADIHNMDLRLLYA